MTFDLPSVMLGVVVGAMLWAFIVWLGHGEFLGSRRVVEARPRRYIARKRGVNPRKAVPDEELKALRKMAGLE